MVLSSYSSHYIPTEEIHAKYVHHTVMNKDLNAFTSEMPCGQILESSCVCILLISLTHAQWFYVVAMLHFIISCLFCCV